MFKKRKTPCSFNQTVYEEEKDSFNCQGSINVYHCIQNERNRSGEICIQSVWVQPNYCPEYNTGANTLDTVPCNVSTGSCPDVLFQSNEVYKYPVCLNKTFTDNKRVSSESSEKILPLPWILVGVGVLILGLFIVGCAVHRIRRKIKNSEEPFYKSAAFHEGVNFIENGGQLVCLIGQWGSGKTSTAAQVYESVTKAPPIIIRNPLEFSVGNQPVIFDDAIVKDMTDIEKDQLKVKIKKLYENMSNSGKAAFIIVTLDENMKHVHDFVKSFVPNTDGTKFINLLDSLTTGDRTQILHSQFGKFGKKGDFSKVEKLALKGNDYSLGYPEICALFSRCEAFQDVGPTIFCNLPLNHLKSYLKDMHISEDCEKSKKFLMLVYMSLNQMEINVGNPNKGLFEILRSCSCGTNKNPNNSKTTKTESSETKKKESDSDKNLCCGTKPKKKEKDNITTLLSNEFVVKKDTSTYRLQHDVIKRMALIVFGTHHFDKLLEFSKQEDLKGWIKMEEFFSNPLENLNDNKPVLVVNKEQWENFQAKFKKPK
uniref:Novel STAND NTPase 3 domain-containing protein n=1 Tax=Magallana gigas TaxID=29159 RepID=A0A8W8N296_MAGGI